MLCKFACDSIPFLFLPLVAGLLNKYGRDLQKGLIDIMVDDVPVKISKKVLNLVFPDVIFNKYQLEALDKFYKAWKDEFDIIITIVP